MGGNTVVVALNGGAFLLFHVGCFWIFFGTTQTQYWRHLVLIMIAVAMNLGPRRWQIIWQTFLCVFCLVLRHVDTKWNAMPCALAVHVCTLPCAPPPCHAVL